jgi:hypothetical protein
MAGMIVSASPNAPRPEDPLTRELADGLARIERNYEREGSGPGSRFEGRLLEDVQAEWAVRTIGRRTAWPWA